ncbi:putative DnaJ domain-containing protein [Ordospora pajunii]|uniref:putative DnaJ domain-containing protein n=1 Tax=Ordospora pajunii TaxID=3039483 RepID=UPI00295275C8|nr:putative DnaJ domain-containing protein [Ordospora pajunii]KAH9412079.1 putative DnaJ domain-containing protein [Ordospora pajunii]
MSLYDVLRIPRNGSKEDVEHAYRLLARQYYRHQDIMDQDNFAEINKAYAILKDDHKRSFYNMFGELSIQLLLHNKDSYIITRIFDRFNILLYLFAFVTNLVALFALPFLVAHNTSVSAFMSVPFGVGMAASIVPAIRSISSLHGVCGFVNELKIMTYASTEVVIMIVHAFNCMLYIEGVVKKGLIIPVCIFIGMEGLSVLNSICYWKLWGQTDGFRKKEMLVQKTWKLILFAGLISQAVPSFTKPLLLLGHIVWSLCSIRYPVFINACVLLLPMLYLSTFSLILAGFRSIAIYIPLGICMALIVASIGFATATIVSVIPKSKYTSKIFGFLSYYEV